MCAQKLSRRELLKLMGMGAAGVALSACGPTPTPEDPAVAPTAAPPATSVSQAEPVTITVLSSSGGRWELPQKGVLGSFQKKFPHINVNFETSKVGEDIAAKIALVLSSGSDAYDVIYNDYSPVIEFIQAGTIIPLQDRIDADPAYKEHLNTIPENVLDLYRDKPAKEGGILYGIPPDSNIQMAYYRTDVFEKAGIEQLPVTWEEAIEVAKELTGGGQYGFGTGLSVGLFAYLGWETVFWTTGAEVYDEEFKVQVDSDEGRMAMEWLLELVQYGYPGILSATDDEANTALINGQVVYAPLQWGNSVATDPNYSPDYWDKIATGLTPKASTPNGRFAPGMGGHGMYIPKAATKNLDAAWEWIKWCTGDGAGDEWVANTGQPASTPILERNLKKQPYFQGLMDGLPYAHRFLPIPENGQIWTQGGQVVSQGLTGELSIDETVITLHKTIEDILRAGGHYS
jgi:ABC-type glycerol-3-phosphate transport system substrate-binding protein